MSDWKKLTASQLASRVIKSGRALDSAGYIRDIASGVEAKKDIIEYIMEQDLNFSVFGDKYSKGGLATKNYVNPVKIVDNRKKKR